MIENSIYKYWGKADKDNNYHLLVYHCLDVAAVGSVLHSHYSEFFENVAYKTHISIDTFKNLFIFFLALHDIGKFSVSFQNLKPEILNELQKKESSKQYDSKKYRHDKMGYLLYHDKIKPFLKTEFNKLFGSVDSGVFYQIFSPLIAVVMGHHGKPISIGNSILNKIFENTDYEASLNYVKSLIELFISKDMIDELNLTIKTFDDNETDFENIINPITWQLAGFTVICDWIASGDGFNMVNENLPLEIYWNISLAKAELAIKNKGIIKAKIPNKNGFENLFPNYIPTPLQHFCNNVVIPETPQMWILEDVTGAGKTEAALTLTSRIMAKKLSDGCFIALPTMATTNSMYSRMAEVYNKLFYDNETPSLILSHGSRHMDKNFRASYKDNIMISDTDGMNIDSNEENKAFCTSWLADSSKKSLLSDIGVGTIDQLLLGILPVRYQCLRFWGMSRKVLVIDEVHACDTYMAKLLETVIEGHASGGGSIILMTATLPIQIRKMYMNAYNKGLGNDGKYENVDEKNFPLITGLSKDGIFTEKKLETRKEVQRKIIVNFCETEESIYSLIDDYLKKEKCVCWMRNTIKDVIYSYNTIIDKNIVNKDNIDVYHSRYTLFDRQLKEAGILKKFGRKSTHEDRKGQLIISSQILQESIDVDFDLIISDLAPMDMLIQRLGRMHRHRRDSKGNIIPDETKSDRESPIFYIHLPPDSENPEATWYSEYFNSASYVYKNTGILWNTQKLLRENKSITMPDDLRELIEGVFGVDIFDIPDTFLDKVIEATGEDNAKKSIANLNMLNLESGYSVESNPLWHEEENVSTRLGDIQVNVYLCKYENQQIIPLYNNVEFPWEMSSLKIRQTMIKELIYSNEIINAIDELKIKEKRKFYPGSIFIVVENHSDEIDMQVTQVDDKKIKIKYSKNFGLEVVA